MSKYVTSSIGTPGIGLRTVRDGNPVLPSIFLEVFCVVFGAFIIAFILGWQWNSLRVRKAKSIKFKNSLVKKADQKHLYS